MPREKAPDKRRTPKAPEERIRARNESAILRAAVELFARKGFDGTRITEIAEACAAMQGCKAEVSYWHKTHGVTNELEQTAVAAAAAAATVGDANVISDIPQSTGGEDFSEMMRVVPGTFSWIGNGTAPDGSVHMVHTPKYNFNDDVIPVGVKFWSEIVRAELDVSV